jgi:hypothetical protein
MEPLLVPRLPDPIACLDETKAANREFTYFARVLFIRDSPCRERLRILSEEKESRG